MKLTIELPEEDVQRYAQVRPHELEYYSPVARAVIVEAKKLYPPYIEGEWYLVERDNRTEVLFRIKDGWSYSTKGNLIYSDKAVETMEFPIVSAVHMVKADD